MSFIIDIIKFILLLIFVVCCGALPVVLACLTVANLMEFGGQLDRQKPKNKKRH